jgi:hypothetical protein
MALGKLSRAKLPNEVQALVDNCREFMRLLDEAMKLPATYTRGRHIAGLLNGLEMAVDRLEHFGIAEQCKKKEAQR